jgi:hypothetical protein
VSDFLILDKAVLLSDADREEVCPLLHHSQLCHLLHM